MKRRRVIQLVFTCSVVLGVWSVLSVVLMSKDDAVLQERGPLNVEVVAQHGVTADDKWTSKWLPNENILKPNSAEMAQMFGGSENEVMQEYVTKTFGAVQLKCHPDKEGITTKRHETLLKALKDYSWQHGRDNGGRVLVWMCTTVDWCGGLADRLKGITYSLLLALFTKRQLLLTWNTAEQKLLGHNALNWSTKARNVQEYGLPLSVFSITQGYGIDREPSLAKKVIEYINGPHKVVYFSTNLEPSALMNRNKSFGIQWISRGLQAIGLANYTVRELDGLVGLVFRYLFVLDLGLVAKLRAVKQHLGLDGVRYVGVHIRTGFVGMVHQEDSNHPKLLHLRGEWEAVLDCAVAMAARHLGNGGLLFLASDSVLVKQMASVKYGSRVRTQNITLQHLDRLLKKPPDKSREELERSVVEGMWTDLLLLAESYLLVTTDSGFGALAGLLCGLTNSKTLNGLACKLA